MRASPLALALLAACARTGPESPPSAERGDEPLGRSSAAVREAVKAATGEDLGADLCTVSPSTFPRVIVVGGFADDRGCMYEGMFVDRTWYGSGGERPTQAVLRTAGWADADAEKRQKLARAWVYEVSNAFGGSFVAETTTAFSFGDTPDFEPPRVSATEDGGVIVSGWIEEPSGMVWESAYHFVEYRFGPDATLDVDVGRHFSVPGERIQAAEASRAADGGP